MALAVAVGKGLLGYALLRFAISLLGDKRMAQSSLSEVLMLALLVAILSGALLRTFLVYEAFAISGFLLLLFLAERYLLTRNSTWRRGLQGEPSMLIYQGKLLEHNLHRKRVAPEQLLSQLRAKSIFSLADVEMAVLEPDGVLSVLKKPALQPLTKEDMAIAGPQGSIAKEVVVHGEIIHEHLSELGLTEKWLLDNLRAFNVEFTGEVALATIDEQGRLLVDTYKDGLIQHPGLHPLSGQKTKKDFFGRHVLEAKPKSNPEQILAERKMRQMAKESLPRVLRKK